MPTHTITEERTVASPPETVAKAIASAHGLGTWLCDEARAEKRPNGRLLFRWNNGTQSVGRWTAFELPAKLAWRWRDDTSGPETEVVFAIEADGEGAKVSVSESSVPDGFFDTWSRQWCNAMDDLRAFVETGENTRYLRRPMIGIMLEAVNDEVQKQHGLAVNRGILITDLVPEGGAEKAGLEKGDVLVQVGDAEVADWASVGAALDAYRSGDSVGLRLWRGGDQIERTVELQGREAAKVPETMAELRDETRRMTADWIQRLESALDGVTEAEAEFKPGEDEWSVKDVLSHLSLAERFGHDWLSRAASDSAPPNYPEDFGQFWQAVVARLPIADLLSRVVSDLEDSEALSLGALDQDPPPWVRHQIGGGLHFSGEHFDDHMTQIEENLKAARTRE